MYRTIDMSSQYLSQAGIKLYQDFQTNVLEPLANSQYYDSALIRIRDLRQYYRTQRNNLPIFTAQTLQNLSQFLESLKQISPQEILAKEWPQNLIDSFDSLLMYIGAEKYSSIIHNNILDKLDHDDDGVISIGDLYETTKTNRFTQ